MASDLLDRKLTAILSADVCGYSRLMGVDEDETFKCLTASREIIFKRIEAHKGRVANTAGDAVLADFGSVRDAVNAATEIQKSLATLNESTPEDRRMYFRIGINLGDVIERGGDLFGDGVNIAARLQSIAEPGGICISGPVYEQARHDPAVLFEYMGEQNVKNIKEPVRTYKVLLGRLPPASAPITQPETHVSTAYSGDYEGLSGHVVAVLPFDNLGEDPSQSYFGDGLTEDLITGLATIEALKVPARNTMFTYKGKPVNIQQIGKDLGATHVVEGSFRKSGNRIRINVQLIEVKSGNHVWAKRYDQELRDLFDIQDEIVHGIVSEVDARFGRGEQARAWRRSTMNAEAHDWLRQAQFLIQHAPTKPNLDRALSMLQKAQSLDGKFVSAYVWESHVYTLRVLMGHEADPKDCMTLAWERAERAVGLDNLSGEAHALRAQLIFFQAMVTSSKDVAQFQLAEKEARLALDLDPKLPDTHQVMGMIRYHEGKYEESLAHYHRQNELYGEFWNQFGIRGEVGSLIALGRLQEAKSFLTPLIKKHRDLTPLLVYSAAIARSLGLVEEAEAARSELLKAIPNYKNSEWFFVFMTTDKTVVEWYQKNFAAAEIP